MMWIVYTYTIPKYQVGDVVRASLAWDVTYVISGIAYEYNTTYPDVLYTGDILPTPNLKLWRPHDYCINERNILRYI